MLKVNIKFVTSGFKLFDKSVELDMLTSKGKNTIEIEDKSILKSAIIYGANNSGKSSFIDALEMMKKVLKKGNVTDFPFFPCRNIFNENSPVSFEVEFIEKKHVYVYGIELFDTKKIKECLYIDNKTAFIRGNQETQEINLNFFDNPYKSIFDLLNSNELFVAKALSFSEKMSNEHINNINRFFGKLHFFDNNERSVFIDLIIECMENETKKSAFNAFLEKADISLVSKELTDEIGIPDFSEEELLKEINKDDQIDKKDIDLILKAIRIKSIYKHGQMKKKVPSEYYDSVGTSKFTNLLLIILSAIENNEIVVIDEIDNSLHFKITRELIKLMNSEINSEAQFIMTAHDIKLLTPLLFRKEQINIIERSKEDVEMYSLGDFEEVRNDASFENLYIKNKVGGLPNPDLSEVLMKWKESLQDGNQES